VLLERIERLERAAAGGGGRAGTGSLVAGPPATESPAQKSDASRESKSLGALRAERAAAGAPEPAAPSRAAAPAAPPEPELAPPPAHLELDDVIVAWAVVLPALPPATKAAARDAQPVAVDDGVITFGVPRHGYTAANERFRREKENIRDALSAELGGTVQFKLVAHDGFESSGASGGASARQPAEPEQEPVGEAPPEHADEDIDFTELVDAPADLDALDSVSKFTASFDATVVEERPRD
jgi:hypothetical protein